MTTTETTDKPSDKAPRLLECDLVMKGGITSGIVYPKAVLALKDTHRFRCIGGTSAGAIAAAAAAAAEYGRETRGADGKDGFARLDDLNACLLERGFLRSLFQPSPRTQVLMEVASAAMRSKTSRFTPVRVAQKLGGVVGALARYTPGAAALGAAGGVGLGLGLSALDGGTAGGARRGSFLGLYGALGALVGSGAALLHTLFRDLPDNGFGLCIGHDPAADGPAARPGKPVLIDWLVGQIEGVGGKEQWAEVEPGMPGAGRRYRVPLTFGDLKGGPHPIYLKMMTTNVSEELPYVLPFESSRFLFEEAAMRRYFPGDVVDHLVARRHVSDRGRRPPPGFHFLPDADDLPIVVAMRMSLSFPILLSAVPLWSLGAGAIEKIKKDGSAAALTPDDLVENWFSDGGLSSNFPIQFFDSWLPTRPTFGIDLTPYPPEAFAGGKLLAEKFVDTPAHGDSAGRAAGRRVADPAASVYLPRANEPPPRIVNALPGLVSFLGAIVSTMQNYRDHQLSQLPSYRERIVQVRLEKTEGGLNLDMPAETLARIAEKGSEAGRALLTDFDMQEHQWTRFRVVMSQLEAELGEMRDRLTPQPPEAAAKFDAQELLLRQQQRGFPYGFAPSSDPEMASQASAWVENVKTVLQEIEALMRAWPQPPATGDKPLFQRKNPKPVSSLRLTPQLYAPLVDAPRVDAPAANGTGPMP